MTDGIPPLSSSRWRERLRALGIVGAVVVALTTAAGTLFTFRESERSARIAEDGLVTERFKNGAEELGANNENVRAGGIYTLVQVAEESLSSDDTSTAHAAYAIISLFVRVNLCNNKNPEDSSVTQFVGPPQSVVTALEVLHEGAHQINLRHLRGCQGADLTDVDLSGADLTDAHLNGVTLEGAKLNDVNFRCANLSGTNFTHRAEFGGADFTAADITEDGFKDAKGLTEQQLRHAYWDIKGKLPTVDRDKKALIRGGPYKSIERLRRKTCQSI